MIRFEAYKGGLFKAAFVEGVWIYFHSRKSLNDYTLEEIMKKATGLESLIPIA